MTETERPETWYGKFIIYSEDLERPYVVAHDFSKGKLQHREKLNTLICVSNGYI